MTRSTPARRLVAAALAALALALAGCRPDDAPRPVRFEGRASGSALVPALEELVRGRSGRYGFVLEHLERGDRFLLDERRPFAAASTYKLALAYEVLRQVGQGRLALDQVLTIGADDAVEPEPAGGLAVGQQVTVRRALEATMGVSSNAAGHALLRLVGRGQLNRSMAALGLVRTRVPPDSGRFAIWRRVVGPHVAVTTPAEMASLLGRLGRGELLDPVGWAELRRLLQLREPLDALAAALPAATVLAKVGNLERASNVVALVETPEGGLLVSLYSEDADPEEARRLGGQLGRTLHAFYTD